MPKWMQYLSHLFRAYDEGIQDEDKPGATPRFRFLAIFVEVWGLMALVLGGIRLAMPGFWHSQVQNGPLACVAAYVMFGLLVGGPGEWFFHRFGLHRLLAFRGLSWLRIVPEAGPNAFVRGCKRAANSITISVVYYIARMAFGHGAHHKITDVTPINPDRLSELFQAINKYEITKNRQTEDAVFPHFSVLGFWAAFTPLDGLEWSAALQRARCSPSSPTLLPGVPGRRG